MKKTEEVCSYGFYSKLLKKPFDSVEELKAAEDEYNKAHAVELRAKEERKAEAEDVKAAITARVEAEIEAKKAKQEAYKIYLEACDKADKSVSEAKAKESEKLTAFCKKHPEGFHDTIQIGNVTYNYDYSTNVVSSYVDPFLRLLSWF